MTNNHIGDIEVGTRGTQLVSLTFQWLAHAHAFPLLQLYPASAAEQRPSFSQKYGIFIDNATGPVSTVRRLDSLDGLRRSALTHAPTRPRFPSQVGEKRLLHCLEQSADRQCSFHAGPCQGRQQRRHAQCTVARGLRCI